MTRSKHTPAALGSKWIRPAKRWAIYARDGYRCVYCLRPSSDPAVRLTLDHVHAVLGKGRNNDPKNLVTACLRCNSRKQGLSQTQWLAVHCVRLEHIREVRARVRRACRRKIDLAVGRLQVERGRLHGWDAVHGGLVA